MGSYDRFHWRLVSVLGRLFGVAGLVVGMIFLGWSIYLLVYPTAPYSVNGLETYDKGARWGQLLVSVVVIILGFYFVRVRSYRPDLGDISIFHRFVDPIETKGQKSPQGSRSWWTGDPKTPHRAG